MSRQEHESLQDRYLKYFPESMFAMNLDEYEEDCREFKKCGIDKTPLECHFLVDGAVYEDIIPFMCGCGNPDIVADAFLVALKSCAWIDEDGVWHDFTKLDRDCEAPRVQEVLHTLLLYIIDYLGYSEHNTSIYASNLTAKGLAARDILEAYFAYFDKETQQ